MTRPDWLDEPHIRAAIDETVDQAPPLTGDQVDLLHRNGFFTSAPARAASDRVSAVRGAEAARGAAGTRPAPAKNPAGTGGSTPTKTTAARSRRAAAGRAAATAQKEG